MLFSRQKFITATHVVAFFVTSIAYAQGTITSSIDCTDVSVHFSDNGELTREERLELMDKALFSSLNKFELCQSARNSNGSSGASGASGASGNAGEAGNNGQGSEGGDAGEGGDTGESGSADGKSVASTGISGTETPKASKIPGEVAESGGVGASSESQDENGKSATSEGKQVSPGSGKLPDDIPLAANDDALAAQIRYAAENEKDPVKKAQLWDEYRKYKGLPTKQ